MGRQIALLAVLLRAGDPLPHGAVAHFAIALAKAADLPIVQVSLRPALSLGCAEQSLPILLILLRGLLLRLGARAGVESATLLRHCLYAFT